MLYLLLFPPGLFLAVLILSNGSNFYLTKLQICWNIPDVFQSYSYSTVDKERWFPARKPLSNWQGSYRYVAPFYRALFHNCCWRRPIHLYGIIFIKVWREPKRN